MQQNAAHQAHLAFETEFTHLSLVSIDNGATEWVARPEAFRTHRDRLILCIHVDAFNALARKNRVKLEIKLKSPRIDATSSIEFWMPGPAKHIWQV